MQNIIVDGKEIQKVGITKFLGLSVDETLSWNDHVDTLIHKISSGLYILRTLAKFRAVEILKLVYFVDKTGSR